MEFLSILGGLGLSATVVVAAAYGLFQLLGQKWLDAKFNERLEAFKHAQERELEQLKFEISKQLDRVSKLHQQEFEVLPTVWRRLSEAFGQAAQFTSPLQSYPDLNRMTPAHLDEFLSKSELEGWQRAELVEEHDKTTKYQKMIFWHDLQRVKSTYADFHNYFITNGVFIQPELKAKLSQLSDLLHEAIIEKEFEEQYPNPRAGRFEKSERVRKEGPQMIKDIESAVQSRLWRELA